jgi:hypothetical protein
LVINLKKGGGYKWEEVIIKIKNEYTIKKRELGKPKINKKKKEKSINIFSLSLSLFLIFE